MKQILIGVLSCRAYEERRQKCLATWVPEIQACEIDLMFLVGGGAGAPRREGNVLHLPCPDDYPSLPQKVQQFYRWALENCEFDYVFKCDDDTYVRADRLLAFKTDDRDYIGSEWTPGVGYASGGAGYWLSRRATTIVAEALTAHPKGAEDVLVGRYLCQAGVPFHNDLRFVAFGNDTRRPTPENDIITTHACDMPWKAHRTEFLGERPVVTCSPMGRLGNNLFQVAAVLGFAAKHGTHVPMFARDSFANYRQTPLRNLRYGDIPNETMRVSDPPDFSFNNQIPAWPTCSVRFQGYMQSERYFAHCSDLIRDTFRIPDEVRNRLEEHFGDELEEQPVCIHIRRGDYLQKPEYHPIQPVEYYWEALRRISQRVSVTRVLCFSDDPDWCEEHLAAWDDRIRVVRQDDEYMDLALMTLCRHHVISNSTFSWWGAWLGFHPDQIVIAPERFFGPGFSGYTEKDLVPAHWIRLGSVAKAPSAGHSRQDSIRRQAVAQFIHREGGTVIDLGCINAPSEFTKLEIEYVSYGGCRPTPGGGRKPLATLISIRPARKFDWAVALDIDRPPTSEAEVALVGNLHFANRRGTVVSWASVNDADVHSTESASIDKRFGKLGYHRDVLEELRLTREETGHECSSKRIRVFRRQLRSVGSPISTDDMRLLIGREDPVILELGCNDGGDSRRLLEAFTGVRLHCFEPDSRPLARFNIQDSRCVLHQIAIAAEDGPLDLHLSGGLPPDGRMTDWDLSSSIHLPTRHLAVHPWCTFDRTSQVEGRRLDSWLAEHAEIATIDLIWVDFQGAEGDLIRGGRKSLRQKTRYLYTKFCNSPMYEGQITRKQILAQLPEFECIGIFEGYKMLLRNRVLT